jgi:hypothetical protein
VSEQPVLTARNIAEVASKGTPARDLPGLTTYGKGALKAPRKASLPLIGGLCGGAQNEENLRSIR